MWGVERWLSIPGYEDIYWASSLGRIKSNYKILNPKHLCNGYKRVVLSFERTEKAFFIHRLVARAFLGECPLNKQVNHKDLDKLNNAIINLEYVTPKQNMNHAFNNRDMNTPKGSQNGISKLNENDILSIRGIYLDGNITQNALARFYKVDQSTINRIVNKVDWRHV